MGKRREGRERAIQFLFQHDLNPPEDLAGALDQFWESQRAASIAGDKAVATWGQVVELPPPTTGEAAVRLFADPLIRGTIEHRDEAAEAIQKHAKNWELHRIAAVDRNILRLGVYELLCEPATPAAVILDEAVEMAKRFGEADSPAFVNGVLDAIRRRVRAPAETPRLKGAPGA